MAGEALVSVTGLSLVNKAARTLKRIRIGETLPEPVATLCLDLLNDLIDSFAIERLMIKVTARVTGPLTSGVGSYSIGAGGNFDVTRPEYVEEAAIIQPNSGNPTYEFPLEILTDQEYAAVPIKGLTDSLPTALQYDATFTGAGTGTLTLYPVPNVGGLTLVLYLPQALSRLPDLQTAIKMPPGYARMLNYNLAVELADPLGVGLSANVQKNAIDSKALVKAVNYSPRQMVAEPMLRTRSRSSFNWLTGQNGRTS